MYRSVSWFLYQIIVRYEGRGIGVDEDLVLSLINGNTSAKITNMYCEITPR